MLTFINRFLENLNHKLDKEIRGVDKEAYLLRFSPSWWHRLIWRHFFKKKNTLVFSSIKGRKLRSSNTHAAKVVHVTNLLCPKRTAHHDLKFRISLSLASIQKARGDRTLFLGCTSDPTINVKGWENFYLSRTSASLFNSPKDFAFLKDMLDAGAEMVGPDDLIFYSNLDCPISPDLYDNLLRNNEDVTEFLRRDIGPPPSYIDIFDSPYSTYEIGIDALSIRKSVYLEMRDKLPDCVIGEPHWDTAYSGILHKHYEVYQNTSDLYHVKHPQHWDDSNLSAAGNHNKRLYHDCINYGLMEDELISLKKQSALILLDPSPKKGNDQHLFNLISQVTPFNNKFEVIFSELVDGHSSTSKRVTNIKYLPIFNTNKYTACLDQENTIINCIFHQLSNYKNIIIFKSSINDINLNLIKQIQLALQAHGFYKNPHIIAIKNNDIPENELDIYGKNDIINKIRDISYINDDGLLELFNNYDPEHI